MNEPSQFITKSTVVAAAVALPAGAGAQTRPTDKPVKRVHYMSGKPPEKTPLFSGVVTYGNMVFIAGIGATSRAISRPIQNMSSTRFRNGGGVGSSMTKF